MTDARVLDTVDIGTALWIQVERANGSRISALLTRTDRTRSISKNDLISVYGSDAIWTPRVCNGKSFLIGMWRPLATNMKPSVPVHLITSAGGT